MAISTRLQLRQSQSLVMTPQLMQSIKLLQLNNIELADFIAEEIEKNPLLEIDAGTSASQRDDASGQLPEQPSTQIRDTSDAIAESGSMTNADVAAQLDGGQENLYESEPVRDESNKPLDAQSSSAVGTGSASGSGTASGEDYNLEEFATKTPDLSEYLTAQAQVELADLHERRVALEIINALDDDGYLREPTREIAEITGTAHNRVLVVLSKVQRFEPAGIAARTLSECLALQLIEKNRFDPAMEALLDNLVLLAKREYATLKKLCNVDDEDLYEMVREIRELDPRPGLGFASGHAETVVPDVIITERSDGGWAIELNADTLPKVLVNRDYYAEVTRGLRDEQEKTFMVDCLQTANWLAKSLDQRAQTILKVAAEIVKQQDGFFAYGVDHLRPLNLKTVADEIGMHESTVSRVTSNKYMLTNRGLFELKYFFTTALASSNGEEEHSSEAVRHQIRRLVDAENPAKILSDDAIVGALNTMGIDIARRTVAKYREAMHIPSSVQRRREKRAERLAVSA